MDKNIQDVIASNEYDYLQAYNIFVKNKEEELKSTISKLASRNNDQKLKDQKMYKLEHQLIKMRQTAIESEKERDALHEEVKRLTNQNALEREDKDFYHRSAMESKRQKKMLKVALSRL